MNARQIAWEAAMKLPGLVVRLLEAKSPTAILEALDAILAVAEGAHRDVTASVEEEKR